MPASQPVTIVEIDERSLDARGQWPWPRTLVAELLQAIGRHEPAAIGIDVIFAEPDRSSPAADAALAAALRATPSVLGFGGEADARRRKPPPPPRAAPFRLASEDALRSLSSHDRPVQSLPLLSDAAPGRGLISADNASGVVRRAIMVARVGGVPVPSLSAEMARLAIGARGFSLTAPVDGLVRLAIAEESVPLQDDGTLWIRYSRHRPERFVSAEDVLAGKVDPDLLREKFVLLGVTGIGLVDQKLVPTGETVPGVEIHAQILEQLIDKTYLLRPAWLAWIEAMLLLAAGWALAAFAPRLPAMRAFAWGIAGVLALPLLAFVAFRAGLLADGVVPAAGLALVLASSLAASFVERDRQARVLREAQARVAGELDAAKRIQMGLLPDPGLVFAEEAAVDLAALLEPARSVGGDFYDCFKLDAHRVFFIAADVSGKGMPAALFMALSKAILKSNALRDASEVGVAVSRANAEISRDNPEALFVTAFAGILDLRTGMLEFTNAGHEPPLARRPGGTLERFDIAEGPPLCVMDDFEYPTSYRPLVPGEWVCVVTDGVTEAMNVAGDLYGTTRLQAVLSALPDGVDATTVRAAVREDVARFVGAAEPSDDLTLVCVRWTGPMVAESGDADLDALLDAPAGDVPPGDPS